MLRAGAAPALSSAKHLRRGGLMNVLVVDGDVGAGIDTTGVLSADHSVRFVRSVAEARSAIKDVRPEAVVCELSLAGRDGGDVLLSWLRTFDPAVRRIVFCNGISPTGFDVDLAHAWVFKPDVQKVEWLLREGAVPRAT